MTQLGTGDSRKLPGEGVNRNSEINNVLGTVAGSSNPAIIKSGTLDSNDVNMSDRGSNPFMP